MDSKLAEQSGATGPRDPLQLGPTILLNLKISEGGSQLNFMKQQMFPHVNTR